MWTPSPRWALGGPWSFLLAALLLATAGCPTDGDDDAAPDDDVGDDDADDDTLEDPDPYVQPDVFVTPMDLQPGDLATVHYAGALRDAQNLDIVYGFDGYNEVDGGGPYTVVEGTANTDYLRQEPMVQTPGGFRATIQVPEAARALHFSFVEPGEDGQVDDRDGRGYHWEVVFPYIGPFLTLPDGEPPHYGLTVNFETSVPCLGRVEYGPTEELENTMWGAEFDTLHHILIGGLESDTTYYYRVVDSRGRASELSSFRTPPEYFETLTFAVIADPQDNGDDSRWAEIAELIEVHSAVELLVLPGDLASDDAPWHWWTFFDKGRHLFATHLMLPAVGNHDTPGTASSTDVSSFTTYFDLPTPTPQDAHYRIEYGPAVFLTLNSEDVESIELGGSQWTWLDLELGELSERQDSPWVFAQWHIPPFDAAARLADQQYDVRDLTAYMDGVVDWTFTGHEHLYQRFAPLHYDGTLAPSGLYGKGPDDGVGHLVAPTAGNREFHDMLAPDDPDAALRDLLAYPVLAADQVLVESELGFVIVDIAGDTIGIQTWGMGTLDDPAPASIVDEVSYTR